MMLLAVVAVVLLILVNVSQSYYITNKNSARRISHNKLLSSIENGVDISSLTDVKSTAKSLGVSIATWLDKEYIPMQIHKEIGDIVEDIYISTRNDNICDLGELLMNIGTRLEAFDMSPSFVNAWDVGNKASDLVMLMLDRELCTCSSTISDDIVLFPPSSSPSSSSATAGTAPTSGTNPGRKKGYTSIALLPSIFLEKTRSLVAIFDRYLFLRQLVDGDRPIEDAQYAVALCLGFRLDDDYIDESPFTINNNQDKIKQVPHLAPRGWENLNQIPDFVYLDDVKLQERIEEDLPDEGSSDIVMESLAGVEMYKIMKRANNPLDNRRILLCKWLYCFGFLTSDAFPFESRFTPGHFDVEDADDDDSDQ